VSDVNVRYLGSADLEAYMALREHSFGYPDDDETRTRFLERLPSIVGAFDRDGRLVASASGFRFETHVGGRAQGLLGIAAVQTAPAARRRGLARRLIRRLLQDARQQGIAWSMLYPFDPDFYARLGWQSLPSSVKLRLPIAACGAPSHVDAHPIQGPLRAALAPLYQRCVVGWNFCDARTAGPWDGWDDLQPVPGTRSSAYDLGEAYLVLRLRDDGADGTTLEVRDQSWCSAAGRSAALALVASYAGQAEWVELEVPRDDPLAWSWSDWYARPTRGTRMVRAIDVGTALTGFDAQQRSDPVAFEIVDPFAAWNAGTWQLENDAGVTRLCATQLQPRARLDVRALALLVGGAASPAAVQRAGLASGESAPLRALAALAGGRTPHHASNDRF